MTKVAWQTHKDDIVKDRPDYAERKFLYHLSRADYEHEWGREYERPGVGTRVLAFFLRLLPHIGPLKALALKAPTPQTEELYFKSIDATVERFRALLSQLRAGHVDLPDRDLDTGNAVRLGEYPLTDRAYEKLCVDLAEHDFQHISPALRDNILEFFGTTPAQQPASKDPQKLATALAKLKAWRPGTHSVAQSATRSGK
jgi:hypothetical protein